MNAAQIAAAKSEAIDFLEYSIFVLCSLLDIDSAGVSHPYVIPVPEDDPQYDQHLSLQRQVSAHATVTA